MSREPQAPITIPMAPNLRDLGGWPTQAGGWTRNGLLFRSTELSRLDGEGLAAFGELGIRIVCDLRTAHELIDQPDVLPPGVHAIHLDVLADREHAAPAEQRTLFAQPERAGELLGGGRAERYFEQAYRDFVTLPSALTAYRQLFQLVADADAVPLLYHCATGKDRTGWATAALLLLLGVSNEDVMEEYLLTNTELLPKTQPWLDQFEAAGGDATLLQPIVGVQESYLESALEQVRASYGDIEGYFATGLGLSEGTLAKLRSDLVQAT